MTTAKVYRPSRDWAGSPMGDGYLGDVTGVIVGAQTSHPLRQNLPGNSTEGMLGIPFSQESGITVEQGDRLVIDGVRYEVVSRRAHHVHQLTGVPLGRYWVHVEQSSA